jgi:hypothetical protein
VLKIYGRAPLLRSWLGIGSGWLRGALRFRAPLRCAPLPAVAPCASLAQAQHKQPVIASGEQRSEASFIFVKHNAEGCFEKYAVYFLTEFLSQGHQVV